MHADLIAVRLNTDFGCHMWQQSWRFSLLNYSVAMLYIVCWRLRLWTCTQKIAYGFAHRYLRVTPRFLFKQALFGVTNTPNLDAWQPTPAPPPAPLQTANIGASFMSSVSHNDYWPAEAPYTSSSASPDKPPAATADELDAPDSKSGTAAQTLRAQCAEVQKAESRPAIDVSNEFSSVFDFL